MVFEKHARLLELIDLGQRLARLEAPTHTWGMYSFLLLCSTFSPKLSCAEEAGVVGDRGTPSG